MGQCNNISMPCNDFLISAMQMFDMLLVDDLCKFIEIYYIKTMTDFEYIEVTTRYSCFVLLQCILGIKSKSKFLLKSSPESLRKIYLPWL